MTTTDIDNVNLKFFENNRDTLIQLSISERKQNGFGVTIIDMSNIEQKPDNVDVKYFPINYPLIDPKLREYLIERKNNVPESVLFFCMVFKDSSINLEIDLASIK